MVTMSMKAFNGKFADQVTRVYLNYLLSAIISIKIIDSISVSSILWLAYFFDYYS